MTDFAAIDFETADNGRDSACAVAVVVVRDGRIAQAIHRHIRPPRQRFLHTRIHGIRWEDVQHAPEFGGVWAELAPLLDGAGFLAAHNAPFDRGVLEECSRAHGLPQAGLPFLCTVQLAREMWNLRPTKLPDVCRFLGLTLKHHDALSDATACANIVLAAVADGYRLDRRVKA